MDHILIFGGTTEGRELAEFCKKHQLFAHVCVATEYGESQLSTDTYISIYAGRLDSNQMITMMKEKSYSMVIDATHPYAILVSENIKKASEEMNLPYIRIVRDSDSMGDYDCITVSSVEEAAKYLNKTSGNVLLTTGSKELSHFTTYCDDFSRFYARIITSESIIHQCLNNGWEAKQLICMQGPFSEDLNYAILKQINANYMVTKESGLAGGFLDKMKAAKRAGVTTIVVGRPLEEKGYTLNQVKTKLLGDIYVSEKQQVAIIGIGMGTKNAMTVEALTLCEQADMFIGASRMLEAVKEYKKPSYMAYKPEDILGYIKSHPQFTKVVVVLSGDTGFYSGAKKLISQCDGWYDIKVCAGISSVSYLCSKLSTTWEDAILLSLHGQKQNLIAAVKNHKKVFALTGNGAEVTKIIAELLEYGLTKVMVTVGENLSYANERIMTNSPDQLQNQEFHGLCVMLFINPYPKDKIVTSGILDEEFIRGKVPMTKSEVRTISLSKLQLKKDSVVYDIGAGTGSVAIEIGLISTEGFVYAIEKKPEAIKLIHENKYKFQVSNLHVIEGSAPEVLTDLPVPSHVFIGGSSGNLKQIVELVLEKNPKVRIVINAIALETVAEALNIGKEYKSDITQVMVSKGKEVGSYHMMMGQNPVYIISFQGGDK